MTGWFGQPWGVRTFRSNISILFWSTVTLFCSLIASFGVLVPLLGWLSSVGRWLGESLNSGLGLKGRGFFLANRFFFATPKKKLSTIFFFIVQSHGFFGICFFYLFGVSWVLSYSVKETLLGWHGSFVLQVWKKTW